MSSRVSEMTASGDRTQQLLEPELVQKIVDELKSQGTFDQFRKDCMAEVDTKPGYQNLRQRVCHSLNKFLDRQQWKPTQNKNQLRNQLRKHIEDSGIMENGVRRIVDQVVNPKILSVIEPEVEYVMYNILGVEKPSNVNDMTNGNEDKASNVSSEDIEMRSVQGHSDEEEHPEGGKKKSSSSTSPILTGNISPLTPERKKDSPSLKGNISPLTPPLPRSQDPGSPHTPPLPPLPPPMYMPPPPQLSDYPPPTGSMSPVSDTELADLSPPEDSPETPSSESGLLSPPPLPPLPQTTQPRRPPSPVTSPICSSPEIRTPPLPPPPSEIPPPPPVHSSGHSDISDTDLPSSAEEKSSDVDIEDLEKAREAILAKMAEASLGKDDSDEGEIHTEDDEHGEKQKREEPQASESDMSPISDDSRNEREKKDDHHEESKKWETKRDKTSSDEDDSKASNPTGARRPDGPKTAEATSAPTNTKESSINSKDEPTTEEDRQKSSKSHCKSHEEKRSEKHHHRRHHSSSSKDKHKEKSMKDLKKMEKIEKIEKKVNKAITLKSDKFKDIDMFAPKAPKPKPPLHRPPSSASSSSSGLSPLPCFGSRSPLPSFGSKSPLSSFGCNKSPLSLGSKTPPTFGSTCGTGSGTTSVNCTKSSPSTSNSPKNTNVQSKSSVPPTVKPIKKPSADPKVKKDPPQKFAKELPSGHEKLSAAILERTKVYPELPVSKSGSDKVKQHEDDFADSKRRLEEARAKRIKEQQKEDLLRRERKRSEKRVSRNLKTDSDSDDHDWEFKPSSKKAGEPRTRRSSSSSSSYCELRSNRSRSNSVREDSTESTDMLKSSRSRSNSMREDPTEILEGLKSNRSRSNSVREDLTEFFHGFTNKVTDSLESKSLALQLIIQADEGSLDESGADEEETISIKGLSDPDSAATILKKHFGGNPKIVNPPPFWLEHKLKSWNVPLEDVGLMSFSKPTHERKSKWRFITEHRFTLKRKQSIATHDLPILRKKAKVKRNDEIVVSQLEREMNAIHSEKPTFWPSNPFYGFETSDLLPPVLEPKLSFLQADLWPQDMKRLFFDPSKESLQTFFSSDDLYEEYDEDFSTKHALNLIIKPNFDHDYLEHDLPSSPSSLDSDEKGSSSPSSSKENVEVQTSRKKSRFPSNKNIIEKTVIPRTRRKVPVLKKVAS